MLLEYKAIKYAYYNNIITNKRLSEIKQKKIVEQRQLPRLQSWVAQQ